MATCLQMARGVHSVDGPVGATEGEVIAVGTREVGVAVDFGAYVDRILVLLLYTTLIFSPLTL